MAVVFFILTAIVLYYETIHQLLTVATFVLGLLFFGLGYFQRPKVATTETETSVIPSITSTITEEETKPRMKATLSNMELTEVRGIGEKRNKQLKTVGIYSVRDLTRASAENLAAKLEMSPKLTRKWIENAKKLAEE
jgi:predicted flap endonuclease-1-like 5' DNA nuclease